MLSAALEEAIERLKAQERATAARAEASERLSGEIISGLTSGLIVVGLRDDVRIMNPAARRLLGLPDAPIAGDYRTVIDEPALSQTIDECLSSGRAILRRTVHLPEGRRAASRFGVTVSPLFDAAGQLHGAVCLFTDLTAVQQLEEQLRLKQSLATVGELTAGIAHEFRNGLATIHGYSKLLDPDTLPPNVRPCVEGIRAEAVSLGEIVTNFLNFARPAQLALSDVDLRALCERVADEARSDARALGGTVTVSGEFGLIQGDEVLLRQAFSNLLRNAVEACTDASVTPTARRQRFRGLQAWHLHRDRRRQRSRRSRGRTGTDLSAVLHVEETRARASASRWSRRSSCRTTAASRWARRRSAARACRSSCRSSDRSSTSADDRGSPDRKNLHRSRRGRLRVVAVCSGISPILRSAPVRLADCSLDGHGAAW